MELPFSPSFFRKIDIYQQLKTFESEHKPIWEAEKQLLMWAAGPGHQNPGQSIGRDIVEQVLVEAMTNGAFRDMPEAAAYAADGYQVTLSLVTRGFADRAPSHVSQIAQINLKGLLAGLVLRETNALKRNYRYEFWIWIWWVVFWGLFIIFLTNVLSALVSIWKQLSPLITYLPLTLNSFWYR